VNTAPFHHSCEHLTAMTCSRGETASERTSRLRSVKAFQKFKTALPGIIATLVALGDHADLLEEFVCIVRDIPTSFARTLCAKRMSRLSITRAMHVARTSSRSVAVEYGTFLVTTLSPEPLTLLLTRMATKTSVDGTTHRPLVPYVQCTH
jgi:hypothetical protein